MLHFQVYSWQERTCILTKLVWELNLAFTKDWENVQHSTSFQLKDVFQFQPFKSCFSFTVLMLPVPNATGLSMSWNGLCPLHLTVTTPSQWTIVAPRHTRQRPQHSTIYITKPKLHVSPAQLPPQSPREATMSPPDGKEWWKGHERRNRVFTDCG